MAINIKPNPNILKVKDLGALWSYKKLTAYVNQPIPFDGRDNGLWRYNGVRYGSFFDKHLCNHVIFFHMGLKKNIGLLMPFLTNFTFRKPKSIKLFDFWPQSSFVYENSLYTFKEGAFFENVVNTNLYPTNNFSFNSILFISLYCVIGFIELWTLGTLTSIILSLIIMLTEEGAKK